MSNEISIALIALIGSALWPGVAVFGILYILKALKSGWLQRVLPEGGTISFGDAKLEVGRSLQHAEDVADKLTEVPKVAEITAADEKADRESEPYDIVMDSWYSLADSITKFSVQHGGYDDRRQVWSNLEILVDKSQLREAEKGAVRDLQKARNSIRRLKAVDRETAVRFAETARRLTRSFEQMAEKN